MMRVMSMSGHKLLRLTPPPDDATPGSDAPQLAKERWTAWRAPVWLRIVIVFWLVAGAAFSFAEGAWIVGAAFLALALMMVVRIKVQGKWI